LGKKRKAKKIKVVFDTNIWVSVLLNKVLTTDFAPVMRGESISICMSYQMLDELARVLTYPKITTVLEAAGVDPRVALASVTERVSLYWVRKGTEHAMSADETDNSVLECALRSKAARQEIFSMQS
jgi:uncharacterized protein